jgi:hypothetical protein
VGDEVVTVPVRSGLDRIGEVDELLLSIVEKVIPCLADSDAVTSDFAEEAIDDLTDARSDWLEDDFKDSIETVQEVSTEAIPEALAEGQILFAAVASALVGILDDVLVLMDFTQTPIFDVFYSNFIESGALGDPGIDEKPCSLSAGVTCDTITATVALGELSSVSGTVGMDELLDEINKKRAEGGLGTSGVSKGEPIIVLIGANGADNSGQDGTSVEQNAPAGHVLMILGGGHGGSGIPGPITSGLAGEKGGNGGTATGEVGQCATLIVVGGDGGTGGMGADGFFLPLPADPLGMGGNGGNGGDAVGCAKECSIIIAFGGYGGTKGPGGRLLISSNNPTAAGPDPGPSGSEGAGGAVNVKACGQANPNLVSGVVAPGPGTPVGGVNINNLPPDKVKQKSRPAPGF